MKGLELSKAYYEAVGKSMIANMFAEYEQRIAVGLVGQGSECYGYDDRLSVDHNFGPSFCMWLTEKDYSEIGVSLQKEYENLPGEFMGFPRRKEDSYSKGRVGALCIPEFYMNFIGTPKAPDKPIQWLRIPESALSTATNGQVFFDGFGDFSEVRRSLLQYYPDDVRLKKIAARAAVMAQSGQYNYDRCMRRGEAVAARMAIGEFIPAATSIFFLLNKQYQPFYKWAHKMMREDQDMAIVAGLLKELSLSSIFELAWGNDSPPNPNTQDGIVNIIEQICGTVIEKFKKEGLSDSKSDFLLVHAEEVMKRIEEPAIRALHVMDG